MFKVNNWDFRATPLTLFCYWTGKCLPGKLCLLKPCLHYREIKKPSCTHHMMLMKRLTYPLPGTLVFPYIIIPGLRKITILTRSRHQHFFRLWRILTRKQLVSCLRLCSCHNIFKISHKCTRDNLFDNERLQRCQCWLIKFSRKG